MNRATPTPLRVLRGNPSKRPLPAGEPKPDAWLGPVPAHVQGAARLEWRRMGKLLRDLGLLTTIDRPAFESYCVSYGDWIDYTAAVHKHGPIVFSPNGYPMPSPYVALARAANKDMRALLAEFGMTPSSRTRVQAAEMVDEDTPLVEILRRRMGPGA